MENNNNSLCAVCHRPGCRWLVRVNGEKLPVHRGCGQTLVRMAPEGQSVKVIPSEELRREWQAQAFWKRLEEARREGRKSVPLAELCQRKNSQAIKADRRTDRTEELVDQVLAGLFTKEKENASADSVSFPEFIFVDSGKEV